VLLKAGNQMKLLPFADNRSAPKAKGASAKREYAIAIATGPYRNAAAAEQTAAAQRVEVAYKEGYEELVQIWDVHGPAFIKEDWRPGERFRAKINLSASK